MKPGEIIIKNTEVLTGLMERNFAPLLIIIICEIANRFGLRMSESYRIKRHRNDLHGTAPVRAIDLSEWVYNDGLAKDTERSINEYWVYDPGRPEKKVAWLHTVRTGP